MIVANMATFPGRRKLIQKVVSLISVQVDLLHLCLNEYTAIPDWVDRFTNVRAFLPNTNLMDVGKFVVPPSKEDFCILVDDDIPYPTNYVSTLMSQHKAISKNIGEKCVVGLHGIIYADLFTGNQAERKVITYWSECKRPELVNQLGTGTVGFCGDIFPKYDYMVGSSGFVDVRFAGHCFESNTKMVCIERAANWLPKEFDEGGGRSLFQEYTLKWPDCVTREVQKFGGYRHIDLDAYLKLASSSSKPKGG